MISKRQTVDRLVKAIWRHDIEPLREALIGGANPNAIKTFSHRGNVSLLMCAAGVQFRKGVEVLIKAGADPNIRAEAGAGAGGGGSALHNAIVSSDTRPEPTATEEDRLIIVELLLNAGADPNAVDQGDSLPLFYAARAGNYEICRRLIDAGATVNAWPLGCIPPLVGVAGGKYHHGLTLSDKWERIAELFLRKGAPVDGESIRGVTALGAVVGSGNERLLNLLLEHGADANHRAKDGRTPLHSAAQYARCARFDDESELALRMVMRLIEAGANPGAKDVEEQSAYDLAVRGDNRVVADYLNRFGGSR